MKLQHIVIEKKVHTIQIISDQQCTTITGEQVTMRLCYGQENRNDEFQSASELPLKEESANEPVIL